MDHDKFFKRNVFVVGVPTSTGQPRDGTELGPTVLRDGGIIERIKAHALSVTDFGDVNLKDLPETDKNSHIKNVATCSEVSRRLNDFVVKHCEANKKNVKSFIERPIIVTLGGDHSLGTGSVHASKSLYSNICVLWIDAHLDINTTKTTETGNVHGMPLSFIVEGACSREDVPKEYSWIKETIKPTDIAFIGIRDADPKELDIVRRLDITTYGALEIENFGIKKCLNDALDKINPFRDRPIHVSFDVDSLDPTIIPSTGTPVPGGLSMREFLYIAETIAQTGLLVSLDIVEVNPKLGLNPHDAKLTVQNTIYASEFFFGRSRFQFVKE